MSSCFSSVWMYDQLRQRVGMQGYVYWPLTFIYLEWLSKKPFFVGDSFVVKLLMNDMGYSTELKSSHSTALLTFSLVMRIRLQVSVVLHVMFVLRLKTFPGPFLDFLYSTEILVLIKVRIFVLVASACVLVWIMRVFAIFIVTSIAFRDVIISY